MSRIDGDHPTKGLVLSAWLDLSREEMSRTEDTEGTEGIKETSAHATAAIGTTGLVPNYPWPAHAPHPGRTRVVPQQNGL
jgi:hypothetical protein